MRIEIKEKKLFSKLIKNKFDLNISSSKVNAICSNSKLIEENDIFIPLKGNVVDGHNYIKEAINKKASLILSEIKIDNRKIVNVGSTRGALNDLAREWLSFFKRPVIAITGSNGKTTTKELIKKIFNKNKQTNCTLGNFNSSVGLPMNLFSFSVDNHPIILEMGASQKDEIEYLCKIAKPDYSLITNIQNAHIGNFKCEVDLIETKTAIFKNTNINGFIIKNDDDKNIANYDCNVRNKINFGFKNTNVDFFGEYRVNPNGNYLTVNGKSIKNIINLTQILAKNMLAAYSLASVYGISHDMIAEAFEEFQIPNGRGNLIKKNNYTIIDDTYNANLESFKMGIKNVSNINCIGKKYIIIGDMKELGVHSEKKHKELGKFIEKLKINYVLGFGESIQSTIDIIKNNQIFSKYFKEKNNLIFFLKKQIQKGDILYFKASRSLKFENIIKKL